MFKKVYKFFHKHYHFNYHNEYRHAKKLFAIDMGLLGLAILLFALSIFFFFWKPDLTDQIDLHFSFGQERLLSGNEMQLVIDYKNHSKHTLEEAILAVHLPTGFIINREKTNQNSFSKNSTFDIGKIEPGGAGQASIYGTIFSTPGADNKITAYLTYRPEEKDKKEQKISASILNLSGSVLSSDIKMASSSFPGRELPVSFTVKNNGNKAISGIFLNIDGDETGFTGDLEDITLKAGESITATGTIQAQTEPGDYKTRFFTVVVVNNKPITQLSIDKIISVFYPNISSDISLAEPKKYADGGDILPLNIKWKNESDYNLKNINIFLTPTNGIVNLGTSAKLGNMTVVGKELLISKKTRTSLANGQPNNSDEFQIDLKLLNKFISKDQNKLNIKIRIEAELADVPDQKFVSSNTGSISIPLSTQLSWEIYPIYYTDDGDQLGRGPLPPQIGETTKYWILTKINNSINPISQNNFQLKLGSGVRFTGRQSVTIGPKLQYNEQSNTVSWNYNLVPAFGDVGLYFEVEIQPNPQQIGKTVTLIKNASYSALDSVINNNLKLSNSSVNNTLLKNDHGFNKGAKVVY